MPLFGSVRKGTIGRTAIDPLVEFEPEARPSLLTMTEIELDLSPLVGGRKVELRMLRVEPISMTKSCGLRRCSMTPDDRVRLG